MVDLNASCIHDCSDEDCFKCYFRGIVFRCPDNCEYFETREGERRERMEREKKRISGSEE